MYYWNPAWAALWLLQKTIVWAVLLVLLLLKPNRNRQAWMIVLPVIFINAVVTVILVKTSILPSFVEEIIPIGINIVVMGLAALWLLSFVLEGMSPVKSSLLAFAFLILGSFPASFITIYNAASPDMMASVIISSIVSFAIVTCLVITRFRVRKRFTPLRFSVQLIPWLFAVSITCMMLFVVIISFFDSGPDFIEMLSIAFIFGSVLGIIESLVIQLYLLATFKIPFYRDRFLAVLRLEDYQPVTITDTVREEAAP